MFVLIRELVDGSVIDLMIIDSGTPVSLVSRGYIDRYLKGARVDNSKVKRLSCTRWFTLRKMLYLSVLEIKFSMVTNTSESDFIKREVMANMIV